MTNYSHQRTFTNHWLSLYNHDNMTIPICDGAFANMMIADYVYEDANFGWVNRYWEHLKLGGVFIIFSDWHSIHRLRCHIEDTCENSVLVNHIVWQNEWGNFPKDRMHQVHDDIVIYSRGLGWKFHPERIQVPKATANTKLNPSGRMTKTATSWIDDIVLTTTAKERIKLNGKCVRWQKPVGLLRRVMSPFLDEGDMVIDLFMGLGTAGVVAKELKCSYTGIEIDEDIYNLAMERLFGE